MKDNTNVVIMPVVKKKPWVNTSQFNKNKLLGASTTLQPYYGENGFQTGLEGNPELQKELESAIGIPEGSLNPVVSNNYWHENLNIKLEDGPTTFNKVNPMDRLKILVLKNHPIVAPSFSEITPDHEFYILDEAAETERKVNKAEKKSKAYITLSNMSPSEQRQFAKLFGKGGVDMSEQDVYAALGVLIEEDVDNFLLKANYSKESINVKAFIFDLVEYNVLRLRGGHYFDSDEDKGDLETLTSYFLAPEKQDVYLNYKERLEHAKLGK